MKYFMKIIFPVIFIVTILGGMAVADTTDVKTLLNDGKNAIEKINSNQVKTWAF